MKKRTVTDKYRRSLYYYSESFKRVRKLCNANLTAKKTFRLELKSNINLRGISSIKAVNRCLITGKKVGSGGFLKVSRLQFLRNTRVNILPGVKKRNS